MVWLFKQSPTYCRPWLGKSFDLHISLLVGYFKKVNAFPVYAMCYHEKVHKVKMTLAKLCWFHLWHDCVIFIFIPTRSPKMQNWVKPLTSLLPVIKQWRILRVFMTYWQWHWFGGHSMACWQRFVICLIDTEAWVVNLLTGTSSLV